MTSSINASTSAGVITTADTSGVLNIQTAGTTAISIDASQAVSFTNSPTVTGGTANGVAYLNGSKVLTTGSALVFDGTNLGLGVTPSTWGSGYRSLDIGNSASFLNSSGSAFVSNNAYQDSGWKYKTSTANIGTQLFGLNPNGSGGYAWFQAASGTAGNAITFTQAMTLDASGRLLLNRTTNNNNEILQISGNANTLCSAFFANTTTGQSYGAYIAAGTNSTDYALRIQNAAANTDYLKVTGDGNVGIGTTSPNAVPDSGFVFQPGWSGAGNSAFAVGHASGSAGGSVYAAWYLNSTSIGSISQSGTTAVAYNTSSDYRLKNTIAPMTGALAKVALLKPCTYKWNADGSDGQGFIAHELAEVVPQCVTGEKNAVNEDGSIKSQGIDTSFLVATLTAAIQEQQALITQLTARITALESA